MKSNLNRIEAEKHIEEVLLNKNSSPDKIKKAKKLAMSRNLKLGDKRKKFCRKCYTLFNSSNSEIKIKRGFKSVRCKKCSNISRYKIYDKKIS